MIENYFFFIKYLKSEYLKNQKRYWDEWKSDWKLFFLYKMISQELEKVSRWMKKRFKEEGSTLSMIIYETGNHRSYLRSYDDSKFA